MERTLKEKRYNMTQYVVLSSAIVANLLVMFCLVVVYLNLSGKMSKEKAKDIVVGPMLVSMFCTLLAWTVWCLT